MTVAALDSGGQFRIGSVISGAWKVFTGNFAFFFLVALVLSLPQLSFSFGSTAPERLATLSPGTIIGMVVIALFMTIFLNTIGQAIMLFAAFQKLRGQPVNIGEAVQRALGRFFPLVGVSILYTFGVFFASILLIVPGIILALMWSVAVAACVVEGLGPTASLSRSSALTKGHRWKIFGAVALLVIIAVIVGIVLGVVLAATGLFGDTGSFVSEIGNLIWMALWMAFSNCLLIMIYHDLRVAKEGIDTHQIAAVFD